MFKDAKLYEKAYEQAVCKNEEAITAIEEFKKELEGVKKILEENQKHLFQHIIAPLAGGKALIKAKLIHTNDVIVFLGDKWFVRTSAVRAADICNRKIARCDENKTEIERQTERFISNMKKAHEYELFSDENLHDIVEPYDEESEKLWREKHREKVREFKIQEAVERSQQRDEDLFRKLDELDKNNFESRVTDEETDLSDMDLLQTNKDDITKNSDVKVYSKFDEVPKSSNLSHKIQSTEFFFNNQIKTSNETANAITRSIESCKNTNNLSMFEEGNTNSLNTYVEPRNSNLTKENHVSSLGLEEAIPTKNIDAASQVMCPGNLCLEENISQKQTTPKKRVSFSTTDELKFYTHLESYANTNVIRFKHSGAIPLPTQHENNQIESPGDISRLVVQCFNLKSILKKEVQLFEEKPHLIEAEKGWKIRCDNFYSDYESSESLVEVVFGDISEKNPVEVPKINTSVRKPSKFRITRNKI